MGRKTDRKMSKILGLRTVAYKVEDITKAIEWDTKVFAREPYFDEPFYVGFNIGGYELGLQPAEENNTTGNSVIAYWGVEDLEKTMANMLSMGAAKCDEALDVGGGVVVTSVRDPWGNIIGLIYNPHFKLDD